MRKQIEDLTRSRSAPPTANQQGMASTPYDANAPTGAAPQIVLSMATPPPHTQYGHLTYPAMQSAPVPNPANPSAPYITSFNYLHGQGVPLGESPPTQLLLKRFPALNKRLIADIFWCKFDQSKNLGRLCA